MVFRSVVALALGGGGVVSGAGGEYRSPLIEDPLPRQVRDEHAGRMIQSLHRMQLERPRRVVDHVLLVDRLEPAPAAGSW